MDLVDFRRLNPAELADHLGIAVTDADGHPDPAILAACLDSAPPSRWPREIEGVTYRVEYTDVTIRRRFGPLVWHETKLVRHVVILSDRI